MNFTISELAEKTGLSVHTLRYYEKEGIIRRVERTAGGRRVYSEECVSMVVGALCLKEAGMTLPQIKEFFDKTAEGMSTLPQRVEMLRNARKNLLQMQEQLADHLRFVEFFIAYCKGAMDSIREGIAPEESHPYLTASGALRFPCVRTEEGRLRPYLPESGMEGNQG